MEKILAAVDFSSISEAVVDQAVALAKVYSADLTFIHVAGPDPEFVGYEVGPVAVRNARAHELRDEHRKLQAVAEEVRTRGVSARALLIQGPAVDTILAEAKQLEADVLVIGSHGHGMLHRALLGSVSEGVVRGARCPVLVVPDPEKAG